MENRENLNKNADYTVKYSNNKKAGKATNISKAAVKINNKKYTGSEIKVTENDITAAIGSGKKKITLEYGKDYEIVDSSYKKNINKGTAEVMIRGLGDYAGEKKVTFKITAK